MQQPAFSTQHSGSDLLSSVLRDGFAVVESVLPPVTVSRLCEVFEDSNHGERNLLELPDVRQLAASKRVRSLAAPILGDDCFAVRALLFDKTQQANWNVVWHQDRVIAVRDRKEAEGFKAWTLKAGVHHVQPRAETVAQMLAIRLHLDDCDELNGPLRLIPGSHQNGFIGGDELQSWKRNEHVICKVKRGDAILMRPLILHSSLRSDLPHRRRVIHIEFAAHGLPCGLEWHTKIA